MHKVPKEVARTDEAYYSNLSHVLATLKERNPSHQGISKWEKVGVGPSYVHSSPWIHAFTILALIVVLSCWYLVLAWLLHLELLQTIRYFRRTPDQPPVALPANGSHSLHIPGSANRRLPVPRRSAYLCPAPDQRSGPQATASRCALHPSSLVLLLASKAMAPTVMAASATSVAPFQGLKSTARLPISRRSSSKGFRNVSNGGRIRCMQVINNLYT